ncbi:hypothetical protein MMC30_002074 [Trapelia coarctata]|nr:hypothetical protein [Trapelia coarctata]
MKRDDTELGNRIHQQDSSSPSQPPTSKLLPGLLIESDELCAQQQRSPSDDAPQLLYPEEPRKGSHGSLTVFGTEEKEVISGFSHLEVLPLEHQDGGESGLQLIIGKEEKEMAATSDSELQVDDRDKSYNLKPRGTRTIRRLVAALAIVIIVAVAALVPTIILKHQRHASNSSSPAALPSMAATPFNTSMPNQTISISHQASALSGTGMALVYPENISDVVWLLYQDIAGSIRRIAYTNSGVWQSSQSLPITNVLNRSSLTTISYIQPSSNGTTMITQLFYIDTGGTLQNMILTSPVNGSSFPESWIPGNLGDYQFQAPLVGGVGMLVLARNGKTIAFETNSAPGITVIGSLSTFMWVYPSVIANSSLSPPVGSIVFYQGPDLTIGSRSFMIGGNSTGIPTKGMAATAIVGGTFGTRGVDLQIDQVFFQLPNGSITLYGHGTAGDSLHLGEVPLG